MPQDILTIEDVTKKIAFEFAEWCSRYECWSPGKWRTYLNVQYTTEQLWEKFLDHQKQQP